MKKTLAMLLWGLLLVACKSRPVSDTLDGSLKDWRSILADIRVQFTELLNTL